MKTPPSKIIQIQVMFFPAGPNNGDCHQLVALCEDGSIWGQWHSMGYSNVPMDGEWFPIAESATQSDSAATIHNLRASLAWAINTFQGESGCGDAYWEQFPEYRIACALLADTQPKEETP